MKKEAMLYEKLDNNYVKCHLCKHYCKIAPSKFGICGVRKNIDGTLYSLVYGEPTASNIDPIEKKPLNHFLPGSQSFSIATIGCNFKCDFCQNWQISQENKKDSHDNSSVDVMPEEIVKQAIRYNCKSISYTYTEPTIFFEYAYDCAKLAKKHKMYNIFVTNGYMTKEALNTIKPYLDAANVDLKSFNEMYYSKYCSAHLQNVLDTIKFMKEAGIWLEITTLIVTGKNDSDDELHQIAEFISKLDNSIPWHISRFHPQYKMLNNLPTPLGTLEKAYKIGQKHGLKYIYLGNVPEGNDTFCPNCKKLLLERKYFSIEKLKIIDGKCSYCNEKIKGIWE